jgi:hypothetical protein
MSASVGHAPHDGMDDWVAVGCQKAFKACPQMRCAEAGTHLFQDLLWERNSPSLREGRRRGTSRRGGGGRWFNGTRIALPVNSLGLVSDPPGGRVEIEVGHAPHDRMDAVPRFSPRKVRQRDLPTRFRLAKRDLRFISPIRRPVSPRRRSFASIPEWRWNAR